MTNQQGDAFSDRFPIEPLVQQIRVRTETVRLETARLETVDKETVDKRVDTPPPAPKLIARPKPSDSNICTRHKKKKVIYYRGKYKYWRCK